MPGPGILGTVPLIMVGLGVTVLFRIDRELRMADHCAWPIVDDHAFGEWGQAASAVVSVTGAMADGVDYELRR